MRVSSSSSETLLWYLFALLIVGNISSFYTIACSRRALFGARRQQSERQTQDDVCQAVISIETLSLFFDSNSQILIELPH